MCLTLWAERLVVILYSVYFYTELLQAVMLLTVNLSRVCHNWQNID